MAPQTVDERVGRSAYSKAVHLAVAKVGQMECHWAVWKAERTVDQWDFVTAVQRVLMWAAWKVDKSVECLVVRSAAQMVVPKAFYWVAHWAAHSDKRMVRKMAAWLANWRAVEKVAQ